MSSAEFVTIDNGDGIDVVTDSDGYRCVRIQNRAFVEDPRYIYVNVSGRYDRRAAISELIAALETLRDESDDQGDIG